MAADYEADLEREFAKWIKGLGGRTIKFTPRGEVGWPDRIVLLPPLPPYPPRQGSGLICWVELKRRCKEPTDMQYYRLLLLRQIGQHAIWGNSLPVLQSKVKALYYGNTL